LEEEGGDVGAGGGVVRFDSFDRLRTGSPQTPDWLTMNGGEGGSGEFHILGASTGLRRW